ncbi:hypothetical protein C8Q74DRAFT_1258208 [Fomes fomentarius]|nr:hypothetical protein C8Q74DRAFT_1258208 [Fomes fomentarius]
MSQSVFDGVLYYISETLPLDKRTQLSETLDARGATPVSVSNPRLTHFITSSLALEDFVESLPDDSTAHVVTPRWVERSGVLGSTQDPEYYSADPAYLFSGVTAAATDLAKNDCEVISAAVAALGGQWRAALTRDVTHLFALAPGSTKYQTAMHYKETTEVCVLVPHWFDDTVRLGIRDLPTRNYEWPEPRVFQSRPEGRTSQEDVDYEPPPERMMLYETASLSNEDQKKLRPASRNIWKGKRLLLGLSLDLSDNHRRALYADIRRQGGDVVELSSSKSLSDEERARDELAKLDDADIFVTRYRTGAAYAKAYQQKKTIGTLAWLWFVRASGTLTRPADQLLHYPVPHHPADGFDKEVVTVTNYTGKDREYLKKLITLMGGSFTPSMSAETNTIVVAAYLHGTKTDKATSWSIPIVNHTWVEDCFVQWRRLTPAREKYIVFPPGVDFSTVLAERGLGKITWEPGQLEEMQRVADAAQAENTWKRRKSNSASASPRKTKKGTRDAEEVDEPPHGTAQSAGEVEQAVGVDPDEDAQMAVDGRTDEMDVDEDEPRSSRVPATKKGPPSKSKRAAAAEVPAKRKLVRRYTMPRRTDDEAEPEDDVPKTPRTYGSARARRLQRGRDGEEEQTESPSPAKKQQTARRKAPAEDEDVEMAEEESESEDQAPKAKPKGTDKEKEKQRKPPARAGKEEKGKEKAVAKKAQVIELESDDSSTEEEDIRSVLGDLIPNRKDKDKSKARAAVSSVTTKALKTPQRMDSVVVPTVSSAYVSPDKPNGMKFGPPKRTSKTAAAPAESDAPLPPRGGKAKKPARALSPSEASIRSSPPPPPSRTLGLENAEAGPSRASSSTSPTKLTRTPSKRSAATKATQKLHNEIMPDLVSFQKEMKKGAVRAAYEHDRGHEELLKSASKGKTPAKGKKRPSVGSTGPETDDDEEDEDEEMPERKKRKISEVEVEKDIGKGKKKAGTWKSMSVDSEEPEGGPSKKAGAAAATNGANSEGRAIRVMTTQVALSDDVVKGLGRMNVKIVTKPTECTHLLVRSVVRTEKFLCAMAVAPYVLSSKWAEMSAFNRKLLPEADYMIKDEETEKKYNFVLAHALKRARRNAGKLFAGITFYVTSKVPVETKLLKNVVTANGGQLSTQNPTVRIMAGHENRFVISCPEDVSIWRPLAQHHKIYTQELILTSALRQEIHWDEVAHQVPGSYRT